jgi:hypothetical protein
MEVARTLRVPAGAFQTYETRENPGERASEFLYAKQHGAPSGFQKL